MCHMPLWSAIRRRSAVIENGTPVLDSTKVCLNGAIGGSASASPGRSSRLAASTLPGKRKACFRKSLAIEYNPLWVQVHAVLGSPAQYQRVERVLSGLYTVGQGFCGIVRFDRDKGAGDDRAAVKLVGDKMNAAAMLVITGVQRALVGIQSRIARQQGGMDVQQPALVVTHEGGCQDAHEAGQHHGIRLAGVDRLDHCLVKLLAVGIVAMIDDAGRHAGGFGARQTGDTGAVAQYQCYLSIQFAIANGIEDCLQVSAAAADQDNQAMTH